MYFGLLCVTKKGTIKNQSKMSHFRFLPEQFLIPQNVLALSVVPRLLNVISIEFTAHLSFFQEGHATVHHAGQPLPLPPLHMPPQLLADRLCVQFNSDTSITLPTFCGTYEQVNRVFSK